MAICFGRWLIARCARTMPRRLPHKCDMAFPHCHIYLRALQLLSQSAHSVRVAGYLPISRRCPTRDAAYDVKLVCYLSFCGCGVGASVAGVFSWHAIRADFPTPQWCLVSPVGLIAGALCWMRLCGCYTPGLPELIRRISWVVRRRAVVSVPTSPSSHLWRS